MGTNAALFPASHEVVHSLLSARGLATIASGTESFFYATAQAGSFYGARAVQYIRDTSVAYYTEIQTLFTAANIGITLYYSKLLIDAAQSQLGVSVINLATASVLTGSCSIIAVAALAAGVSFVILRTMEKPPAEDRVIERETGDVTVSEKKTGFHYFVQTMQTAKLVTNVALACLTMNQTWMLLTLASSAYSLYKNMDTKWLFFSKEMQQDGDSVTATYALLAHQAPAEAEGEACPICLEQGGDTAFCTNHVFHRTCLEQYVADRSDEFGQAHMGIERVEHYRYGVHTHTTHRVDVHVDAGIIPPCPTCRERPRQNPLSYTAHLAGSSGLTTRTHIEGRPSEFKPLFENGNAVFATLQSGLSYLQQFPELAASIYQIQCVLQVGNVISMAITSGYLYDELRQRMTPLTGLEENDLMHKIYAATATAVTVVATTCFSHVVAQQMSRLFDSQVDPSEALATLAPDDSTVSLAWTKPFSQYVMQVIHTNQAILSGLMAALTNNTAYLTAAGAHLFTMVNLSKLQWLEGTRESTTPLEDILEGEGGAFGAHEDYWNTGTLSAKVTYLVPTALAHQAGSLREEVSKIYTSLKGIFSNTFWSRYALVSRNGVREVCEATLPYSLFTPLSSDRVSTTLSGISMSFYNTLYRDFPNTAYQYSGMRIVYERLMAYLR